MPIFANIKIKLDLSGQEGNIYYILAKVKAEMKRNGVSDTHILDFQKDLAGVSDYFSKLRIVAKWVNFNDGEYL
jgi:hypothetical protein